MKTKSKRGRPRKFDDVCVVVHLKIGEHLLARVDREWHKRQLTNRADTMRLLIEEGIESSK